MSSRQPDTTPVARRRVAAAGLVLVLAGVVSCGTDPQSGDGSPPVASSTSPTPSSSVSIRPAGTPVPQVLSPQLADPAFVKVPSVGISATLQPLHLDTHNTLVPPPYGKAGWYEAGPEPGEVGPAVIVGHLDSKTGPDTFYELGKVEPGQRIVVGLEDGSTLAFRVSAIEEFSQGRFPTARVYGATAEPELRLITCAGDYDHEAGHYKDNLVVFADLTS